LSGENRRQLAVLLGLVVLNSVVGAVEYSSLAHSGAEVVSEWNRGGSRGQNVVLFKREGAAVGGGELELERYDDGGGGNGAEHPDDHHDHDTAHPPPFQVLPVVNRPLQVGFLICNM